MPKTEPEMTASDVVEIIQLFNQHQIDVYIDGGWGVDALLGEQTRPHADLDIAVQHKDVARIRALLEARAYQDVPRDDTRECNFVLGDDAGRQFDTYIFLPYNSFDFLRNFCFVSYFESYAGVAGGQRTSPG